MSALIGIRVKISAGGMSASTAACHVVRYAAPPTLPVKRRMSETYAAHCSRA